MSNLPALGDNNWGNTLNDFLRVSLNADGTLTGVSVAAADTVEYVIKAADGSDITDELIAAVNDQSSATTINILIPTGIYYVSQPITCPDNKAIRLSGKGKFQSTLRWGVGYTDFAGRCAIEGSSINPLPLEIHHLCIVGPDQNGPNGNSLGYPPGYINGVLATSGCIIDDSIVTQFYASVVMSGNRHVITRSTLTSYYGIYYPSNASDSGQGDYIAACVFAGSLFAAIACAADAVIRCSIVRCHMGFGPYCFYKEPTNSSHPTVSDFMSGCVMVVCNLEGYGNADIYDATGQAAITNCSFFNCGGWGSSYGFSIPAQNSPDGVAPAVGPAMTVGSFNNNRVYAWPFGHGGVSAQSFYGNTFKAVGIIDGYVGSGAPPIAIGQNNVYGNLIDEGDRKATLAVASGSISANQPVELAAVSGNAFTVKRATGNAPIIGISLTNSPDGTVVAVGTHGCYFAQSADNNQTFPLNSQLFYNSDGTFGTSGSTFLGYAASSYPATNGLCSVYTNNLLF